MTDERTFLIVGAALAGATAARTLREEGFGGRIVLVGEEPHRPYLRPPLSKDYLQGAADRSTLFVESEDWYAGHDVELLQGVRALSVDPVDRLVALDNLTEVPYSKLLLATGSAARRPAVEGARLEGVHVLRTLDDSEALRAMLVGGGKRVVVVGAGWIGLEVAASATTLGNDVVVLGRGRVPLASALGDEVGAVFAGLHRDHGVQLRSGATVDSVAGVDGRVSEVVLAGGERMPADLVVFGVGASPNLELAESAGLAIDDGVVVDAALRSSVPDILAAGDIAGVLHPRVGLRLRSEHWANALKTGAAAARSMLGLEVEYDEIPYFYTDQFDLGMEYSGYPPLAQGADVVFRGSVAEREFIAFWVREGRVVAGMNVNVWDVNETVQRIIRSGSAVDRDALADEQVPLTTFLT